MHNFTNVLFIIVILVGLSAFSGKIRLPLPILLLIVGVLLGMAPFLPDLALDPEIVFLVFLPPILYDAASKTSWLDFKKEIRPISTLAITLVFFTTVAVAVAAHYFIPGFSWPLAFLLGAIVSPPDAVAATSITKGLGLNRRVITIIEGESLVNDASALIAYKYAVTATISGVFVFWKAGLGFLLVSTGGIIIGLVLGYLLVFVHKRITDNEIVETSMSLLTPFVAYALAERCHVSGVLAVVTAGFFISWNSREIFSFQTRLQTKVVWDTVVFVINGLVFILIGLQMPAIITGFKEYSFIQMLGYGLLVTFVTIAVRIIWVFVGAYNQSIFRRNKAVTPADDDGQEVSWKNVLIVAWTGTRGVVSLATALALPIALKDGAGFPQRNHILFFTFIVILFTLVVQGLTLPLLIRLLGIKTEDGLQKKQDRDLELTLTENILRFINEGIPGEIDEKVKDQVRKIYDTNYNILSQKKRVNSLPKATLISQLTFITQMLSVQLEIVRYKRELLIRYQKEGTFNEESIIKTVSELDIEEMRIHSMISKREDDSKRL
ncbi:MAG: Na+/H+ antiporter [Ferruginibacter sp.]